jgi:signal transduction histidine kinase/ActR/RegA family two-component response regulator
VVGWQIAELPPLLLRATPRRGLAPAILFVLWTALAAPAPAWSQLEPRGVLLINSYNVGYEWTDELTRGVRAGLESHGVPIDLSVEFLDARRRGEELFPQMHALLAARYSPAKTAVIIAADDPALQFLLEHAADLLPSVPVVYCGVSSDALVARAPRSRFTGVREVMSVSPALDVAVSLHAPRRVFVVSDATLTSTSVRHSLEAYARQQQRGLQMVYLDGRVLTLDQVLTTLRRDTTARDLVMTTPFTRDHSGRSFPARESVAQIAAASTAPTYGPLATGVGQGLVASGINAGFEHGLTTARLAMAVLRGRPPAEVPIESFNRIGYQFDYRQLIRYGVADSQLPTAALVVGRPRSFYGENRLLIWVTTLFILGQTVVIAAFTRNVVQRRKAERELARTEANLRQSQKMDAVGRLAGGIAHDFNNLLTVINGHSELLREVPDQLTAADAVNSLDEIQKAGNQAASLTRQLLAFSRKQILQARVVNLNQIVHQVESMLGRLIGEQIALTTALDPDLLNLSVDPGQIQQVIVNLVVNARDAMPNGGRIVVGTRNADRFPAAAGALGRGARPCVILTVSDTGVGMSAETRAQIFEPFFTTKSEGKGTGLGLATVYGIVRQSGGWIDVDSEVGRGTTFTLYFPSTQAAQQPLEPKAAEGSVKRVAATLLVVEDQPEVRELAVSALRRAGYDVFEAADGDEAFARFGPRASTIALLLTDVVMPGMNGRELAERLRARHPHLLVVFMSGYAHDILDWQELAGPGAAFLAKPFTPAALVRQVDRMLLSRQKAKTRGAH